MYLPNFRYERKLWRLGFKIVAGLDEVGRGCFAGPVVASAVAFAPDSNLQFPIFDKKGQEIKINDSKKLFSEQRETAAKWIKKNAYAYGVGSASAKLINRLGMAKATQTAFRRAISQANRKLEIRSLKLDQSSFISHHTSNIQFLLIDAFFIPYVKGLPKGTKKIKGNGRLKSRLARQLAIVNGDEKSLSIAAASIVAKVYRDNLMESLSKKSKYKKYKWHKNKGYATKEHRDAILKYGITGYHRKRFVETYLRKHEARNPKYRA